MGQPSHSVGASGPRPRGGRRVSCVPAEQGSVGSWAHSKNPQNTSCWRRRSLHLGGVLRPGRRRRRCSSGAALSNSSDPSTGVFVGWMGVASRIDSCPRPRRPKPESSLPRGALRQEGKPCWELSPHPPTRSRSRPRCCQVAASSRRCLWSVHWLLSSASCRSSLATFRTSTTS